MAALTISANDGQASYTVGATPTTGPFNIDFPYFLASEITVTKTVSGTETELTLTTDYSLSGVAADDGYSSGAITLVAPVSNCTITITREISTEKAVNLAVAGPLQVSVINTYFSRLFSWVQDMKRRFDQVEASIDTAASSAAQAAADAAEIQTLLSAFSTGVVEDLPPAASNAGVFKLITDALAPNVTQPVVGGGAVSVLVYSNGEAWYPVNQPEDMTGKTPYPAEVITLTDPVTVFGHSYWADSAQTSRICVFDLLRGTYVFGTLDNEGKAGQDTTEIADRVDDTDTTIVDPDAGLTRAEQVAGDVILGMGRNLFSNTAGRSTVMTTGFADLARAVAELTGEYLIVCDHTGRNYPIGQAVWAQCEVWKRTVMQDYPNQSVDWYWQLAKWCEGSDQDLIDLFNGAPPSSMTTYETGEVDTTHAGTRGNKAMAYEPIYNWMRWRADPAGSFFMPPFHEAWLTGFAAATAVTTSGAVYTTPRQGTGIAFSLQEGDATKFAVNASTGAVTCVSTFVAAEPYYDLVIRGTKGGVSIDTTLRLWIGKDTYGCDDRAVSRDTGGPIAFADAPSGISSKAISVIVGVQCGTGTDGDRMYLLGSESSSLALYRDTDNKVKLICRNSTGTTIVSMVSSATLTEADGMTWVAVSADLLPGSPTESMYFNGTNVLAGGSTLTSGGTIDWNKRAVILADSPSLTYAWEGTLRDFWCATSYIDWAVSARRDERFNSGTKAAVALPSNGAINSITPIYWTPGNIADLYWGRCGTGQNAGTGPEGVGCARHYDNPGAGGQIDGNFTPLDLGSKLKAWWTADDYGTANMTVETGDRVITWVDRISAVTLSQTSLDTKRPTYYANYNADGIASVYFDQASVAQHLASASISALPNGTTAGNMYAAVNLDTVGQIVSYGTNGGNTLRRLTSNGTNNPTASDGSVTAQAAGSDVFSEWTLVSGSFNTAAHAVKLNGSTVKTSVAAPSMNTGTTVMRVGSSLATTPAGGFTGQLKHLFVTLGTLTTDEEQKLEGWMAWDLGVTDKLPATHPYKSYRP